MKQLKQLLALVLATLFLLGLCSCQKGSDSRNSDSAISYPIEFGINANTLSQKDRDFYSAYIEDYVKIVKNDFANSQQTRSFDSSLFVGNIFLYDFREVNADSLSNEEKTLFQGITKYGDLYITCDGGSTYFDASWWYPSLPYDATNLFINERNEYTVKDIYKIMCNYFVFEIPEGTKIINFGNEYSFSYHPTQEECRDGQLPLSVLTPAE